MNTKVSTDSLMNYLIRQLCENPVIGQLEKIISERSSKAGKRREEVFTREFLCLYIRKYFYEHVRSELNLSDEEISKGLGTEGYENCKGFGFSPARKRKHLFTKSDIIKSSPPDAWFAKNESRLSPFRPCPDFAISKPLPFSVVGEVKYFKSGSPKKAVKELYDASRQAVFYLGAFHGHYDSAMIVVADASPKHSFLKGLQLVEPGLLERFGAETNIYLLTAGLR